MSTPTMLDVIKSNFDRRAEVAEDIRHIAEAATNEQRQLTEAENADFEAKRAELADIDKRCSAMVEMEGRRADNANGLEAMFGAVLNTHGRVEDTRSIGQRFVDSDEFRAHAANPGGSYRMEFDGVDLRAITTVDGSSNPLAGSTHLSRIGKDVADRRVFVTDLLPSIPVATGSVEYVQDKTTSGGYDGAEQTEGSSKQESTPTYTVVTENTATIAVHAGLTRQVYDDWGQIPGYLDGRLRYGLRRRLDNEVVAGNGTAPNLKGLANRTGIKTYTASVIEEAAVSIRKAITVGQQADSVYEIAVLNPADAEKFDLLNVSTAGLHSTPDTASALPATAWGLTRVTSNAVASGTALLVDPMACSLLDRQQPAAYLTDSHASEFTSNILRLLLEMRVGLALFDVTGVCKVTFKYS